LHLLAWCCVAHPAWAQIASAEPGKVVTAANFDKVNLRTHWLETVLDASHGLGPDALFALPAAQFGPSPGKIARNLGLDKVLLIKAKLQLNPTGEAAMLDIPMARLDSVRVHYRPEGGVWRSSHLGDHVPYKNWPFMNTHPSLPIVGAGASVDLLLEVRHAGRFTTPVWIKSDGVFRTERLQLGVYNGLIVGFMVAMAMVCVASWRAFGNSAFNWVAMQLLLYALGTLAYHGYGDMLIWGDANAWWRDQGKFVCSVLILAMLLPMFSAALGLRKSDRLLWILCQTAGVLTLCAAFVIPLLLAAQARVAAAAALSLCVLGAAAWLCALVVRRRERIGTWLSVCLAMYAFCIVMTAVDNVAYVELVDMATLAPVGYALGTLFVIYGLYTSHRFGNVVLAPHSGGDVRFDPSTGLPNRAGFADALAAQVLRLRFSHTVAVLLWVRLSGTQTLAQSQGRDAFEAALVKLCASLVGYLAPGETIARLEDDTLAILAGTRQDRESADLLSSQVLARCIAAFDERDQISVRMVVAPIPTVDSSMSGIAHLCERALKATPPSKHIIKLNSKGQPI
jgi:GGDEF domain-containing protein